MTMTDTRRWLLAGSMIGAALCLVTGHLWNVPSTLPARTYVEQVGAHRSTFLAATVLTSVAALLLIAASYGVARLVEERSPRLATAGWILSAIGAAGLALGVSIIGFTMGMLTAHDNVLAERVFTIASTDWFVSLPLDVAPLLFIGLLLLAIAHLRRGSRWQPILLIIGLAGAFGAPSGGLAGALGHVPLALALTALAVRLWRVAPVAASAGHQPAAGTQARTGARDVDRTVAAPSTRVP